jgi:hypothetical protein
MMFSPSPEMMDALADLAFNELPSLPQAEVKRLLNGILAIVTAELNRQGKILAEDPTVEALVIANLDRRHASLRQEPAG